MRPYPSVTRLAAALLLFAATAGRAASIPPNDATTTPAPTPAPPAGASPLRTLGGGIT